eukprot:6712125-Pyramimonas_sp.AAC.1
MTHRTDVLDALNYARNGSRVDGVPPAGFERRLAALTNPYRNLQPEPPSVRHSFAGAGAAKKANRNCFTRVRASSLSSTPSSPPPSRLRRR